MNQDAYILQKTVQKYDMRKITLKYKKKNKNRKLFFTILSMKENY